MSTTSNALVQPDTRDDRVDFVLDLVRKGPTDPDHGLLKMMVAPDLSAEDIARALLANEV